MSDQKVPSPSWVAFDAEGLPEAFARTDRYSLAQFVKMCPTAVRIEQVEGAERTALLAIYVGGSQ